MGFPVSLPWSLPIDEYNPSSSTFGDLTYDGEHTAEGLALLLEQFKGKPLIEGHVGSFLNQVQDLEDAIWEILLCTDIDHATNAQLEGLGDLVGEGRRERTDAQYRAAIRVRILVNRCNGRHGEILKILTLFLGATDGDGSIKLTDPAPASMRLQVYSVPAVVPDLAAILAQVKPGGVQLDARYETSATRPYRFGWSGGDVASITGLANGDGWSGATGTGGLHAARI